MQPVLTGSVGALANRLMANRLMANRSTGPGLTNLDYLVDFEYRFDSSGKGAIPPLKQTNNLVDFSTANPGQVPPHCRSPMNMERLWAGDMSQLPNLQLSSLDIKSQNRLIKLVMHPNKIAEGEEPPLCNICEDRATGVHYGSIICEW